MSSNKKGSLSHILVFVVTAVAIGAGVFFWQKRSTEGQLDKISQDARTTRGEYENRIDNLKEKISKNEKEIKTLEEKNNELSQKAEQLNESKREFKLDPLGITIEYPALFGEVVMDIQTSSSSKYILGKFIDNEKLDFYSVSDQSEKESDEGNYKINEILNFSFEEDNTALNVIGLEKSIKVNPALKVEGGNFKAILLDANSFVEAIETPKDLGGNLLGIISVRDEGEYQSIIFVNKDFGVLPVDKFKKLLKEVQ